MLTYCTNIHRGESWAETFANLKAHIPSVKAMVSPDQSFPIGLRLSARAAAEIDERERCRLLEWCAEHDCFVPTLNGFPYGLFHGRPIKDAVYLPDWRHLERVRYTTQLARLLAAWLPEGVGGSISTVPLGYSGAVDAADKPHMCRNLLLALRELDRVRQQTGKGLMIALEPEPGCVVETTKEVVQLFEELELPRDLEGTLGVCFDCCHQAVLFEDPHTSLRLLEDAGIPIAKIQVSSALRARPGQIEALSAWVEPNYLHQVAARGDDGRVLCYSDLPHALAQAPRHSEWRVHFHVPVFAATVGEFSTTRFFLEEILRDVGGDPLLEVETYTWEVIPRQWREDTITESIARELMWVRTQRDAPDRCS